MPHHDALHWALLHDSLICPSGSVNPLLICPPAPTSQSHKWDSACDRGRGDARSGPVISEISEIALMER